MDFNVQAHVLPPIVILVMLTIGMELRWQQFSELLRQPRTPIIGTLIHTLCFPSIAVAIIVCVQLLNIPLSDAAVIGMLLIAACPSGGFSNVLALMAGVNLPLSVTLTFVSSIASFATVPLLIGSFSWLISDLDKPVSLPVGATVIQLLVLIVLPIGSGMLIRMWREVFVARHLARVQHVVQILLYICIALLIFESRDTVMAGIGEALPWSLLLCGANIVCCYQAAKWSGLGVEDRITVALEGSIRNLAVAVLIAANVLGRMDIAALPTVYFIAVLVVGVVFAKTWRRLIAQPSPQDV